MTALAHYVLAVHDGDLDVPFAGAARLLREAIDAGYVTAGAACTQGGVERARPVKCTRAGIRWLRDLGLVRVGESTY